MGSEARIQTLTRAPIAKKMRSMKQIDLSAARSAALTLLALVSLICAGCTTTGGAGDESEEPPVIDASAPSAEAAAEVADAAPMPEEGSKQEEGEVPLPVAESEHPAEAPPKEVIVQGSRARHDAIHDFVAEAQTLLHDVGARSGRRTTSASRHSTARKRRGARGAPGSCPCR